MSVIYFYVPVVVFALFALASFCYYYFSSRRHFWVPPIILASLHAISVVVLAVRIVSIRDDSGCPSEMLWLMFFGIDVPVSYLLIPISKIMEDYGFAIVNYWLPLVFFIVFGTGQYFAVGTGLAWGMSRFVGRRHSLRKSSS
ncbi:MAG: hypothetical protein V1809_06245 [Planctomycetota bacterium]